MTEDNKLQISDELPAGLMLFCANCGHNISMHTETRELGKNDNYIDSICRYDNGHFVCNCLGYKEQKLE